MKEGILRKDFTAPYFEDGPLKRSWYFIPDVIDINQLQLGVVSRKWYQQRPKRVGAVNNSMWFIIHSVEHKCWLINCDMSMMHDIKMADINFVLLRSYDLISM